MNTNERESQSRESQINARRIVGVRNAYYIESSNSEKKENENKSKKRARSSPRAARRIVCVRNTDYKRLSRLRETRGRSTWEIEEAESKGGEKNKSNGSKLHSQC